jgi:hypothetical protein
MSCDKMDDIQTMLQAKEEKRDFICDSGVKFMKRSLFHTRSKIFVCQ